MKRAEFSFVMDQDMADSLMGAGIYKTPKYFQFNESLLSEKQSTDMVDLEPGVLLELKVAERNGGYRNKVLRTRSQI